MTQAQLVNQEYTRWKEASGLEKELRQLSLVKSLERLALSICWRRIPDLRGEFPWVVNEAIYRAISKEKEFGGRSQFSVWFFRIVTNECNRLLKRTKRIWGLSVGLEHAETASMGNDRHTLAVEQATRNLDWEAQTLIALKSEGWSTAEIAGILETTEAAVKMRWSRLKGRLRDGRV